MNPAQLAAMSTLLSVPQRPRIVDYAVTTAAAATIDFMLPSRRESGLLAIAFVASNNTSTPTTPTNWTSIGTNFATPRYRVAYKYLDGSEEQTASSAATSSTDMTAIVVTIAGSLSSRPPTCSGSSAGTAITSLAPASLNASIPFGSLLWFQWLNMNAVQEEIDRPIGFSTSHRNVAKGAGFANILVAENIAQRTVSPTSWTFASCNANCVAVAVRGA